MSQSLTRVLLSFHVKVKVQLLARSEEKEVFLKHPHELARLRGEGVKVQVSASQGVWGKDWHFWNIRRSIQGSVDIKTTVLALSSWVQSTSWGPTLDST